MRAFISRPFGTKNDINFDEVEKQLIDPALNRLDITGRTTILLFNSPGATRFALAPGYHISRLRRFGTKGKE